MKEKDTFYQNILTLLEVKDMMIIDLTKRLKKAEHDRDRYKKYIEKEKEKEKGE